MTPLKKSNIVARFFASLSEVVDELLQKERAVDISAIFTAVQNKLDEVQVETEYGTISSGYVNNVYVDDEGIFAVCNKSDGKLYKIAVTVDANSQITLGEEQEVVQEFTPVSRGLMINREADGKVRWFAMPACTAILNRSGEIDSRALFDSFVDHVDRTGEYPELDFFHLGEHLVLGKADRVFRDGVNYCVSGLFDDSDIARAAIDALEKDSAYWGLSIAYIPTKEPEKLRNSEGIEIDVYNVGINRFVSLLPESTAASIFTSISTQEEVNRMNEKQKKALKELCGDNTELFNDMVAKLDSVNRSAENMISREQTAPADTSMTPAAKTAPVPAKKREYTEEDVAAIVGSDVFKAAVSTVLTEIRAAESAADDGEEGEETPVTEPSTTPAPVVEARTTDQLLAELIAKVDGVVKSREAEEAVENDLPEKIKRAKMVRPRNAATILPNQLVGKERTELPLSEIAERTLEKMGAAE